GHANFQILNDDISAGCALLDEPRGGLFSANCSETSSRSSRQRRAEILASSAADFGGIGSQRRKLSKRATSSSGAVSLSPGDSMSPSKVTMEPTSSPFCQRLNALPSA